jgi:small subunit ribosomal protein S2
MTQPNLEQLLEAGVHFGHQTRRWNPKMRRFIFAERNGIHIIDLQKTLRQLELAEKLVRDVVARGDNILFVCTKRQLKGIVQAEAERCGAMFVTERWLGGMLTNFQTVKKQVRRLKDLEAGSEEGGAFQDYTKKEQLMMSRERDKLGKYLSGIKNMNRLPGLMFVIDSKKEKIAVTEANKLGIPIVAIVDTNADPDLITVPIAGNDDAIRSVELLTRAIADTVEEARREAPKREEAEEESEGPTTYSSDRGSEPADDSERRRRRRTRRRRAKPEAIAARLKTTGDEQGEGTEGTPAPRVVRPESPARAPEPPAAPEANAQTESAE